MGLSELHPEAADSLPTQTGLSHDESDSKDSIACDCRAQKKHLQSEYVCILPPR